jgi:hypothetical protein
LYIGIRSNYGKTRNIHRLFIHPFYFPVWYRLGDTAEPEFYVKAGITKLHGVSEMNLNNDWFMLIVVFLTALAFGLLFYFMVEALVKYGL